ncbi:DNA cytosine methyltransferase [Kordia sp.]|uniref:DNA cytosine methyltransferase n=1 Tax=Kordia sp. TaxID=1965332 RepID=UPI003B5C270E
MTHNFPLKTLQRLHEPRKFELIDEFDQIDNEFIKIKYSHRSFTVNEAPFIDTSSVQTIGLFSGAGGLDIGAQLAGSKVISSLDFNLDSVKTLEANNFFKHTHHFHKDIKEVNASLYKDILRENNPEKLILIGGPPCQPFSKAGYWKKHENRLGSDDPRNMIGNYLRLIEELKPNGFILENVESLLHPKNIVAVEKLEEAIDKLGYNHIKFRVNAADFGIPQKRKRVFFIASKNTIELDPVKTHGTEEERVFNSNLKPYERVIDWIGKYDDPKYSNDYDSIDGKYYEDLMAIPPGQNYFALTQKRGYPNPRFIARKRYWSFLLKLHPLLPSWTIIASPGHWEGPFHWTGRRLRLKELAAIQTFPEDYNFIGSRRSIQKQIGNAVPPLLGKIVVQHLTKHL